MDPARRPIFNAAWSPELFGRVMQRLEARVGPFPFRVAETPLLMTGALRDKLARHAVEIVGQLSQPARLARFRRAVPAHYDVPGMDDLPNCVQVDFALTQGAGGALDGKVVELQAFPSLYALMGMMSDAWAEEMNRIPGLEADWSSFIGLDRDAAVERMRKAIVADYDPVEVALVDYEPQNQKTSPDFEATRLLFGVESADVAKLEVDGRKIFRRRADGSRVQVKRIYNRMVFDELEQKGVHVPFRWTDDLDVTWCSHPNWYWVWSKYVLPHLDHPAVPRARLLSDLAEPPRDLTAFVMKPLFSFAGAGVVIDLTPDSIANVPAHLRDKWIIQEKIDYAPAVVMPDGSGVKVEVRVMLLRPPGEKDLVPLLCLVRMSRGKMLGVDFNKNMTWVGGSVGMWSR